MESGTQSVVGSPASQSVAAASALNGPILIAGYGSIGRRHFQNLSALGCRNFVFYRSRQGTIDDAEVRDFPSTNNLAEALSYRPAVAIIANPTALHCDVALQAANAGCDLYIEKPLADKRDRLKELASVVREHKLVTMIGCQFRFHPLLIQLREQIHAGRIGRIIGASAEWGEYLPGWHPWEDHRKSYSSRPELGGGVILTLIHCLDYLYWLFGRPNRVNAVTTKVPSLETVAGEDFAEITAEFPDGVVGRIHLDYIQRPPVHRLTVVGDAGRACWDFHAGELSWTRVDGQSEHQHVPPTFDRNAMFMDAMQHFLNCAANRSSTSIPLADGIQVLEMALHAREAAGVPA